MGTTVRVVLYASDAPAAEALAAAAFSRIGALEDRLSDYRESSELMALCRAAGRAPIPVSEDLFTVLTAAHAFASRTHGAFDVTVGPVSRVWRHARATGELPDLSRLAEAQRLVGFAKMQLSAERRTVRLAERGMLLDLGGIAKGFAADEALAVLAARGAHQAIVAVGGDVAAGEAPPGTAGWEIGSRRSVRIAAVRCRR